LAERARALGDLIEQLRVYVRAYPERKDPNTASLFDVRNDFFGIACSHRGQTIG
jgi:hypothetical protein